MTSSWQILTHVQIDWFTGPRSDLRSSFELADDSASELDSYIELGRVLVASIEGRIAGHLQLTEAGSTGDIEIKSLAVGDEQQGTGIGRALVANAVDWAVATGYQRVLVATGAADIGNLRFYQRVGFRFLSVERDAFTPETGYPETIMIEGIQLLDRVWFSMDL